MPGLVEIVILGLATFRLASLLSEERGPYNIFGHLRNAFGEYWSTPEHRRMATTEIGRGLICFDCTSVWVAVVMSVVYFLWPDVLWIAVPLAMSGLAMVVNKFVSM